MVWLDFLDILCKYISSIILDGSMRLVRVLSQPAKFEVVLDAPAKSKYMHDNI
jgi:hypothetical protein